NLIASASFWRCSSVSVALRKVGPTRLALPERAARFLRRALRFSTQAGSARHFSFAALIRSWHAASHVFRAGLLGGAGSDCVPESEVFGSVPSSARAPGAYAKKPSIPAVTNSRFITVPPSALVGPHRDDGSSAQLSRVFLCGNA